MAFSHVDNSNQPRMVDVSDKSITSRTAQAECRVMLPPEVTGAASDNEILAPKGPVFQTAIIAGIQAVKNTSQLIPMCHPLPINGVNIQIQLEGNQAVIACEVKTQGKTGVEMEALTGASVAALTIYDMCKALSHDITIERVRLMQKSGGKRDFKR